ncbi:MAG: leucine-rich repeat domain-containing protein [Salinivirgaceae bacterium]|nr:leucine-rich repeat domain-containing protein [Salinivirgaceae bacterium]
MNFIQNGAQSFLSFKTPKEFEEEYGWNYQPSDDEYYIVNESDDTVNYLYDEENVDEFSYFAEGEILSENSFIASLKRKIYGPMQINFPTHLLEDLEEIEMAEYEISELDGVEFCVHAKNMDLSYNQIFDISKLEHCVFIQELYLGNNSIHYIDSLYHMPDLRILDLSNNQVEDISPILKSKSLEFANLIGNPIPVAQINMLKEMGVAVVF